MSLARLGARIIARRTAMATSEKISYAKTPYRLLSSSVRDNLDAYVSETRSDKAHEGKIEGCSQQCYVLSTWIRSKLAIAIQRYSDHESSILREGTSRIMRGCTRWGRRRNGTRRDVCWPTRFFQTQRPGVGWPSTRWTAPRANQVWWLGTKREMHGLLGRDLNPATYGSIS